MVKLTPHCSCAGSTWFWELFGIRSSSDCQRYGSFVFTGQIESTWKTNLHQEIPLLTILWMSFLSICFLVFIGTYCWLFVITNWPLWTIFRDHIVLNCEHCPGYSLTVSHQPAMSRRFINYFYNLQFSLGLSLSRSFMCARLCLCFLVGHAMSPQFLINCQIGHMCPRQLCTALKKLK